MARSHAVRNLLVANGWHDGRRISEGTIRPTLVEAYGVAPENAIAILEEFDNLLINARPTGGFWIQFQSAMLRSLSYRSDLPIVGKFIGLPVVPIAQCQLGVVFVSSLNKAAIVDPDWVFVYVADSFDSLLEYICCVRPTLQEVIIPDDERPADFRS